jgi:non-ribosomal peptide synthetase component E (peptide arylation enzyme)
MVSINESNKLVFEGRKSGKVEIAGMTVIPEEIEKVLLKYSGVENAAVVSVSDQVRENILMAYVMTDDKISSEVLKAYLHEHLPAYMIPKKIVMCKNLPLTSMGKIDKKKIVSNLGLSPVRS